MSKESIRRSVSLWTPEHLKPGDLCFASANAQTCLLGFSSEENIRQIYRTTESVYETARMLRQLDRSVRWSADHDFDTGQIFIYVNALHAVTGYGTDHFFYQVLYKNDRIFLNVEPTLTWP